MPEIFVFLHVGDDPLVTLFIHSIRRHIPDACIIQCSDPDTPKLEGVDKYASIEGNAQQLMTFRLRAFTSLALQTPAMYLDTDMLIVRPITPHNILGKDDVAVCGRKFHRDASLNTSIRGIDLQEYQGKTLGEIYPYVACATITRDYTFWQETERTLLGMDPKFHLWYGDQEAIREVVKAKTFKTKTIAESMYGCLPEYFQKVPEAPRILHFKGSRKKLMPQFFEKYKGGKLLAPLQG